MRTFRLNALRFTCVLFFSGFVMPANAQGVLVKQANVVVNANCHGYLEYLPPGYNPLGTQKYPLLLFFNGHGTQGTGSATDLNKFFTGGGTPPEQCDLGWWVPSYTVGGQTFSFIVITPQFIRSFCCDPMPNAGEVDGIINYMIQHYKVDESRIYMTGVSSGAWIPFEYVATGGQFANRIAAIAPFATTSWVSQDKADTVAKYDVPVWAFHNQNDINVFAVNTINWVNSINNPTAPVVSPVPQAKMTIFPGVSSHVCWWDPYLRNYSENGLNLYEWMLQYSRPVVNNSPLPVNFSNLNASCKNGEILLSWKTSSEKNTSEFSVEKSSDGRSWNVIAKVDAAGQSNAEQTYSYFDKNGEGNLYRVVANDVDGRKTYSSIVKGSCADAGSFSIFPSPVIDEAVLQISLSSKSMVSFSIIDNSGRLVKKQQKLLPKGTNQFTINLHELAAGIYTINASWDKGSRRTRFVKQ